MLGKKKNDFGHFQYFSIIFDISDPVILIFIFTISYIESHKVIYKNYITI